MLVSKIVGRDRTELTLLMQKLKRHMFTKMKINFTHFAYLKMEV